MTLGRRVTETHPPVRPRIDSILGIHRKSPLVDVRHQNETNDYRPAAIPAERYVWSQFVTICLTDNPSAIRFVVACTAQPTVPTSPTKTILSQFVH